MADRTTIIVSDLHMGAGFRTQCDPLDDFDKDAEFAGLLRELKVESERDGREIELIVDGDLVDFPQVPAVEEFDPSVVYPPQDYSTTLEADSVKKMNLVVAGHRDFFASLRDFLSPGPPRRTLTILKGNHDVELHWPGVQQRIREAVGASGEQAGLVHFEEVCIHRDGLYVEHGNQYAAYCDRLDNFENPVDPQDPQRLTLTAGSQALIEAFNPVERERYWIDGVKPMTALIFYLLKWDFDFAMRALASLLKGVPILVPKAMAADQETLLAELDDEVRRQALATQYAADADFRHDFNARVLSAMETLHEPAGPGILAGPPVASALELGRREQERARLALGRAAQKIATEKGAKLVVFGHTHLAGDEPLEGGARYLNSGAWVWCHDFSTADEATWRELFEHPEHFTGDRYLTHVRVDYDAAGQPVGRLVEYTGQPQPGGCLGLLMRAWAWVQRGL